MIIYATRTAQGLEHFVGKEVWVNVRLRNPAGYSFIRVLSYDNGAYTYNAIRECRLSKDGACHCSEDRKALILKNTYTSDAYNIELTKPLELMTTDEIFVIDE